MLAFAVEKLAMMLHEAGREAVARNLVVRNDVPVRPFVEWQDLTEDAKEGRRVQARYLIDHAVDFRVSYASPHRIATLGLQLHEGPQNGLFALAGSVGAANVARPSYVGEDVARAQSEL